MQRVMKRLGGWSPLAICSAVASVLFAASSSLAVPIDLTNATPTVTGATTLYIGGISTLGSSYWADFEWNDNSNVFQVSFYGEEEDPPPPEGFSRLSAGEFAMGSPDNELGRENDETQRDVTISQDFYIGITEVTQAQWVSVMGTNPSRFSECDECPVERINWHDAVDYCNALSTAEGLIPAYKVDGMSVDWEQDSDGYRLPTEAEWEYACRAGSNAAFSSGNITNTDCSPLDPNLDEIGWYCGNASERTQGVGQKAPNSWGLHDMSGNVYEWCWDWYDEYPSGPSTDPIGPQEGSYRVARGGGWYYVARRCRSADRDWFVTDHRYDRMGLRIARTIR